MKVFRRGRLSWLSLSAAIGVAFTSFAAIPGLTASAAADDHGGQQDGLLGLFAQQQHVQRSGSSSSSVGACGATTETATASQTDRSYGGQGQTGLLGLYDQWQAGGSRSSAVADAQPCGSSSGAFGAASEYQQQSTPLGLYQQSQGGSSQAVSSAGSTCHEGSSSSSGAASYASAQQQGGLLGLAPQQQYVVESTSSSATTCAGATTGTATGATTGATTEASTSTTRGQQQAGLLGTSYSSSQSPSHGCVVVLPGSGLRGPCLLGGQDQDSRTGDQQQCTAGAFYGADAAGWQTCLVGAQRQHRGATSEQDSCLLLARQDPLGLSCAIGHQHQEAVPGLGSAGQQQSGLVGDQQQGPAGQQQSGLLGLYHQQQSPAIP